MKDLTEIFYYLGKRINILDLSFYLLIKFAAVVADGVCHRFNNGFDKNHAQSGFRAKRELSPAVNLL